MRYTNINIVSLLKVGQHLSTTKCNDYNISISSFDNKKGLIEEKNWTLCEGKHNLFTHGGCTIFTLLNLFYFATKYKKGVKINIPDFLELLPKSFLLQSWKTNEQLNKRFPLSVFFFITTFSFWCFPHFTLIW